MHHRSRSLLALFGLVGFLGARAAEPVPGIVIEAERYTRRLPNDDSFATPAKSATARGGLGLSKLFGDRGHLEYVFTVPHPAVYRVWVRYSANRDQSLGYALGAAAEADRRRTTRVALKGTGDLEVWQWARLGEARLAPGAHTLTLHPAPLRLDCIWITSTDDPPGEALVQPHALARTREHLQQPIEPIAPGWLAEADAYRLPDWYEQIRVCAHTRLSWPTRSRNPETFARAGRLLHSIGFRSVARHIKSGSEPAWWPSAVGAVLPEATERNFAQEIIDEAHASGCRILVYSRHMEDEFIATRHPDWQARDEQGRTVRRRGPMLCLNTPYADYFETRLLELARLGADGFYFDEMHMVKPICHCERCRQGFEQVTGLKYPAGGTAWDPVYQKAIEYRNSVLERVFRQWRAAVHRVNPGCVLLIGSNTYPSMHDRHTTHRLWRIADAMKSEFNLAARLGNNRIFAADRSLAPPELDARIALGYTLNRDACDGRPPHVWAHGIPDARQMRFATAGMITHGQVANLDHPEATIPDHARFGPAVDLGNRISPAFAGARPLRWAAVHFSEYARDHYVPDEAAMWKQVLYPVYGAFTTLLRARLPVGVVTDSQLEQGRLDGYRVLFLPAPQHLTNRMREAVAAFRAAGGQVVEQAPDWTWHRPETGMKESSRALLAAIGPAADVAPIRVSGGTERMHAVPFVTPNRRRLTVALVNDFSWVQTGAAENAKARAKGAPPKSTSGEGENEGTLARGAGKPPPPCQGVSVRVRTTQVPVRITDLVTGVDLSPRPVPGGFAVELPGFDCVSVLVVELPGAL